ncbi:MAG: hypothetical protein KAJ14_07145, partial [Candidatus Omnitrophica bacterium]|nr:hypothetical protein [Candidatus Omnitrophota bacterium]
YFMEKKTIKKNRWLFLYICSLFFIAELVLVNFFPVGEVYFENSSDMMEFRISKNKTIGYELGPNTCESNSDGLHDREHEIIKDSNVVRIMIIGDSVAYGLGVLPEENYASQLEKLLNIETMKYEVINLGVIGYDALQIYERFIEKGLKYKPDIVIYGYWFNDHHVILNPFEINFFGNCCKDMLWELYIQCRMRFPSLTNIVKFISNRELTKRIILLNKSIEKNRALSGRSKSKRVRLLKEQVSKEQIDHLYNLFERKSAILEDSACDIGFMDGETSREEFIEFVRTIENLKTKCIQNSIRLIIISTPVLDDFKNYKYTPLYEFLYEFTNSLNIEYFDTVKAFYKEDCRALEISETDNIHFNKYGHSIVAKAIAEHLLKNINLGDQGLNIYYE